MSETNDTAMSQTEVAIETPSIAARMETNGTSKYTVDVTDAFGDAKDVTHFGNRSKISMPVDRYAAEYNMKHPKRGLALIFNHENYNVPDQVIEPRTGTNVDCENLTATLRYLDFDVRVYKDLKLRDMLNEVEKVSKMDHSDNDCVCIAIMTHGGINHLYASDCQYEPDIVWSYFTADHCPTLAGKPKLFFIQACRGDETDAGTTLTKRTTETDSAGSMCYKIPVHADFLIAYSSFSGFFSFRNVKRGSWFVQALCLELNQHGKKYDLLTLLTFVSQRVAYDFESCVPDEPTLHGKKQIPCVTTMLTRLLYFADK